MNRWLTGSVVGCANVGAQFHCRSKHLRCVHLTTNTLPSDREPMAESHTAEEASLGLVSSDILTPQKARLAL